MEIACLDLEGVLVPEIWIEFAKVTGIEELKATTRDIPDYDVLMKQRLRILEQLLTVREAENIDVLYLRDRVLTGLIDGAWAFEAITKEAYGRLRDLHSNAFDLRHKELMQ